MLAVTLALAIVQSPYREQFPLPDLTVPSGLGVNIHIIEPKDNTIQRIAASGFKWIRMDMLWNEIERRKGSYDFSRYDKLNDQLRQSKLRPIYILDYGNDYYEKGAPRSPQARAAFVAFVHATLQHYGHQGAVWELYNEPNIHFWEPQPNVNEYIALAREVGHEIRANEPDEWFIGPAVSGMDWNFLQACMKAGLLQYWDAVSVHPYRNAPPETAAKDWQHLREMIGQYAPKGKAVEIICSEWGYNSLSFGEQKQADYASRQYLANLGSWVPLTIWYDWSDDVADKRAEERHYGVVRADLSSKPALLSIYTMMRELKGWKVTNAIFNDAAVLTFRRGAFSKGVAWAVNGARATAQIPLPVGDYVQRSFSTDTHVVHAGPTGMTVQVGSTPTYFSPVQTGK